MTEIPTADRNSGSGFVAELAWYWRQWPGKALWFGLLAAWILLFQFLGNSTFGYIDTHSLFRWMYYAYNTAAEDKHGLFIPVVVLVLAWWRRRELLASVEGVWWPACGLLVLAVGIHLVAYLVQQSRISIVAFYLGIYALMGLVWGRRFLVVSFFPMVLFIFAVPVSTVSDVVTYPLRILVTKISVGIGQYVLAMPLVREGSRILSGSGVYDVAPACSGIRSLTVLGALTVVYAFFRFQSGWRRAVILLAAFPIAVAGNVARLTTLLILGDVLGQARAMSLEQDLGLVTFVVALACLFALGYWLEPKGESTAEAAPVPIRPPVGPGLFPWSALVVVLVLLGGTAAALGRIGAGHSLGKPGVKVVAEPTMLEGGGIAKTNSVYLPAAVPEFASLPAEITPLEVNWLPKDTLFGRRVYVTPPYDPLGSKLMAATNRIQANVVLMGTDRTSIHKPQYCLDSQGFRIEKSEVVTIPIARPYPYELRAIKLTSAPLRVKDDSDQQVRTVRALYVYWFVADGELTHDHLERMWWMARDLIRTGVLQRWGYVSFFNVCLTGQEDAAFHRMKELISASVPEFQLTSGPRTSVNSTAALK